MAWGLIVEVVALGVYSVLALELLKLKPHVSGISQHKLQLKNHPSTKHGNLAPSNRHMISSFSSILILKKSLRHFLLESRHRLPASAQADAKTESSILIMWCQNWCQNWCLGTSFGTSLGAKSHVWHLCGTCFGISVAPLLAPLLALVWHHFWHHFGQFIIHFRGFNAFHVLM